MHDYTEIDLKLMGYNYWNEKTGKILRITDTVELFEKDISDGVGVDSMSYMRIPNFFLRKCIRIT